jgi:hypothetical protein
VLPTSLAALIIAVLFLLPGAVYTWSFEREAGNFGVKLADRTFRFVTFSMIFHIILGWAEYFVFRVVGPFNGIGVAQFAAIWGSTVFNVGVPAAIGTTLGGLYATRNDRTQWRNIRKFISGEAERKLLRLTLGKDPAPRAWDHFFSERPACFLRIRTVDGEAIAGMYADRSYAGAFPHDCDLLLEETWSQDEDGQLNAPLGYPSYIHADQIGVIEILLLGGNEEDTDGEQEGAASAGEREEGRI